MRNVTVLQVKTFRRMQWSLVSPANNYSIIFIVKNKQQRMHYYTRRKIMAKKVRYNGGTESYYGCSDPTNLVVGKEYEVVLSKDRGWQTDYILKGIDGEFNSVWFDEVSSDIR